MTGGGTAGHVSPITAVASEVKRRLPDADIHFVGQAGDRFAKLVDDAPEVNKRHRVLAGKWRRYHGIPMWKQLLDIPTVLLNLRDLLFVLVGFMQSLALMVWYRPNVVFVKGGFVGVPVGLAAALTRRKIVTHDSDAVPGITNRLVGRWAVKNATGMPINYYNYPKDRAVYVGVPITGDYKHVSVKQQLAAKDELGFDPKRPLVLITGGSLGAERINHAVVAIAPELLEFANVVHVCGQNNLEHTAMNLTGRGVDVEVGESYKLLPFVANDLYKYSAAADVVVARTGASSTAELAAQGKAVVMVPNPRLTGGHQLENAKVMANAKAALIVDESKLMENPGILLDAIKTLVDDGEYRAELGAALHKFAIPDAAEKLAAVVVKVAAGAELNTHEE